MGDLKNGLTIGQDTEWSCTKCTNDHDFSMPAERWESKDFQLDLSDPLLGGAPGMYVCEVHMTDKAGNRLIENLMDKYGPLWYRSNPKLIDGYVFNVFTYRLPELLPICSTIEVPAPCCMIDLNESVGPTFAADLAAGAHGSLIYNGNITLFSAAAPNFPAGWAFAPGSLQFILVPCEVQTGDAVFRTSGGGGGIAYPLTVKPCDRKFGLCFIDVPADLYNTANYFYLDGVGASFVGPIFGITPSPMQFVSDQPKHTFDPVTNKWRVPVDCELADHILVLGISGPHGIETVLSVVTDPTDCPCYFEVDAADYTDADQFTFDGILSAAYATPVLMQPLGVIPYVTGNAVHVYDAASNKWRVPVDCRLRTHTLTISFSTNPTREPVVITAIPDPNCIRRMMTVKTDCFRLEFEIGIDQFCGTTTVYSEPMECPLCQPTLMISSNYKGGEDVLGNVYDLDSFEDIVGYPGDGDLRTFKNNLRIPAVLRNLPSKVTVTRNDNCFAYRSEMVEQYRIQGTKAFPPYFAKMVENIMAGAKFLIEGVLYETTSDTIFTVLTEKGFAALRLDAVLTKCPTVVVFDCSP